MRYAIRPALAALVLAMCATSLPAQEPEQPKPFARVRLEPGPRVTVGQPLTVVVEVLVPTWFTAAPSFPDLDVGDAIAIFEDSGVNFTERIDHQTWSAQSRSYQVYPQRSGTFEIDAIHVRVRYHAEDTGSRTQVMVSPPPIRFEAVIPDAARELPYFIGSTGLTVEQSFHPTPEALKVGDAFTRTITVTVKDALSMVIPPISSEPISGLALYPAPPIVKDEGGERGEAYVGTRVERVTLVAEREGDYRLPEIELKWWDIGARRVRTEVVPALELHVEAAPDHVVDIPLPPEELVEGKAGAMRGPRISLLDLLRRWGIPIAAAGLILLLLSRLWRRYAPAVRRSAAEARQRRRESEATYFAAFRVATRRSDPVATWNSWTTWLDRIQTGPGAATIRDFVDAAGDPDLQAATDALDARLFADGGDDRGAWSGRALYRCVARLRRRRARVRPQDNLERLARTLNPRGNPQQ